MTTDELIREYGKELGCELDVHLLIDSHRNIRNMVKAGLQSANEARASGFLNGVEFGKKHIVGGLTRDDVMGMSIAELIEWMNEGE